MKDEIQDLRRTSKGLRFIGCVLVLGIIDIIPITAIEYFILDDKEYPYGILAAINAALIIGFKFLFSIPIIKEKNG